MKRLILFLLVSVMLISVVACNGGSDPAVTTDDAASSKDVAETTGEKADDTASDPKETKPDTADTEKKEDEAKLYDSPDLKKAEQDVVYKRVGNTELLMTIYRPTAEKFEKAPVLYLVTGGGWNTCDRKGMYGMVGATAGSLRAAGWYVTTIDYRILGSTATKMDEIISDCMDGVRYLIHFENELKIDKNSIAILGHSAGGHLALMTAIGDQELFVTDSPFGTEGYKYDPIECVALSPLTVCYSVGGKVLTACTHISQLFGGSKINQACHDASPLEYVRKDMCPVIIAAGTEDNAIDPENTYMFRDKAAEVGADVTTIISENAGHCFEDVNGKATVTLAQIQKQVSETLRAMKK